MHVFVKTEIEIWTEAETETETKIWTEAEIGNGQRQRYRKRQE